jgi:hypothetical protein
MHPGEGYEVSIIYTTGASLSNWFNIYRPIQAVESLVPVVGPPVRNSSLL